METNERDELIRAIRRQELTSMHAHIQSRIDGLAKFERMYDRDPKRSIEKASVQAEMKLLRNLRSELQVRLARLSDRVVEYDK